MVELKSGSMMGELALVNRAPRLGTAVANFNSHVAIMDSTDFNKIFSG
jgi:hypothetical protein